MFKSKRAKNIFKHTLLSIIFAIIALFVVIFLYNNSKTATKSQTCPEQITQEITHIWQNHPEKIPQKYLILEQEYKTTPLSVRTTGHCNNKRFVCEMKQVRQYCDPCAAIKAHKHAMTLHIQDEIKKICIQ